MALHSPVSVLKAQLAKLTQIAAHDQDLTHVMEEWAQGANGQPVLSTEEIRMTGDGALGSYGLRDGSVIRLIPLSGFEEAVPDGEDEEESETDAPAGLLEASMSSHSIMSTIGPAEADHSYNGILFDISAKAPFQVAITSVHVGGMLGHITIFACDKEWEEDYEEENQVSQLHTILLVLKCKKAFAEQEAEHSALGSVVLIWICSLLACTFVSPKPITSTIGPRCRG